MSSENQTLSTYNMMESGLPIIVNGDGKSTVSMIFYLGMALLLGWAIVILILVRHYWLDWLIGVFALTRQLHANRAREGEGGGGGVAESEASSLGSLSRHASGRKGSSSRGKNTGQKRTSLIRNSIRGLWTKSNDGQNAVRYCPAALETDTNENINGQNSPIALIVA